MNVKSVEKLEKSQVAVTVEVTAEEFEAAVQKAYLKMRNKISVPGFRPGKAPRKMIEKLYGEGVFYSDAVDAALPEAYTQAIGSSGLDVVGYPEVEIVDDQIGKDGFTFKATVAVYPEVKLGKYKGVSAPKEEVKVTADDVKERLEQMAERESRLVSVDRKVKKGDTAVIDFEGFDNGVAFEGGKGENHELEIGSGSFVPGFEDQLIGMKAGEEKDIDITFPENYAPDLAGKQVVFHVKVNEVKEKQVPALDDEFAKDVSEFETLKELKDDIKAKIAAEREQSVKIAFENALLEKVAGDIEADIPDAMIDEQCRRFLEEFKQRLQAQGIPYDQYCKMTNMDETKFMEDGKEPATRQVKMDLAIAAIIKAESLDVTDEEVEEKYKSMAEQYGMELEMLKKYLDAPTVREQLLNEKAVAVVVDSAKAEKAEGEEEKKPAAKKTTKKAAEGEAEKKPAAKKTAKKAAEGEEEKKPAAKKTTKKAAEGEAEKKPAAKKTTKKAAEKAE
ncbi:trigger factor [Oscillibacter valericigenes]|nr:trigger factor [Oscillibacter valericigenes]